MKIKKTFKKMFEKFKSFFKMLKDGSIFVKLTTIIMPIGYFKRKQFGRGILYTLFQTVFIIFFATIGYSNLIKIKTLGTIEYDQVYNPETGRNEVNNYDNSFLILLYSLITIIFIIVFIYVWIKNIKINYELEELSKKEKEIPKMKDDIKIFIDEKFHVTLLSLPVLGVVIFTMIPLIFMFLVAFTNFDNLHQPPIKLFTWVGLDNFKNLFKMGGTASNFAYSFRKVLVWTLIWAFFATFTSYIGGILLALFINSKNVKGKKIWRTIFVITIAVPQFVSLLLVKNFFANHGIVNTLIRKTNLLQTFKNMGLVKEGLNYVPFLTDPIWTRVMLILINFWIGVPYVMLITTGVLMNIPKDLYEAAEIDGASKFKSFIKITMPYMLFITTPYLITSFIHNMNNFNVIYLLTYDRPTSDLYLASVDARDVDLLVTWLFRLTSEKANYNMASTIGVVLFLISVVFTLLAFNYTLKEGREDRFQ